MSVLAYLKDACTYANYAFSREYKHLLLLLFYTLVFFLIHGYLLEVMKGVHPVPDPKRSIEELVKGIFVTITGFVYLIIPVLIGTFVLHRTDSHQPATIPGNPAYTLIAEITNHVPGLISFVIAFYFIGLFAIPGIVRYARTARLGDVFGFSETIALVRRIGWSEFLLGVLILDLVYLVIFVISCIIAFIPFIGWLLRCLPSLYGLLFVARFASLLYDAGCKPVPSGDP